MRTEPRHRFGLATVVLLGALSWLSTCTPPGIPEEAKPRPALPEPDLILPAVLEDDGAPVDPFSEAFVLAEGGVFDRAATQVREAIEEENLNGGGVLAFRGLAPDGEDDAPRVDVVKLVHLGPRRVAPPEMIQTDPPAILDLVAFTDSEAEEADAVLHVELPSLAPGLVPLQGPEGGDAAAGRLAWLRDGTFTQDAPTALWSYWRPVGSPESRTDAGPLAPVGAFAIVETVPKGERFAPVAVCGWLSSHDTRRALEIVRGRLWISLPLLPPLEARPPAEEEQPPPPAEDEPVPPASEPQSQAPADPTDG